MRSSFGTLSGRRGARLLVALSLAFAAQSLALAQDEKLYYFVDEHGVPHISNTPTDPRYKPYTPGKRGEEPAASSHAQEPLPPEELDSSPDEPSDQDLDPPDVEPGPVRAPPQNPAR